MRIIRQTVSMATRREAKSKGQRQPVPEGVAAMPEDRCCAWWLRDGLGRPSRIVRLAARSENLQLVDEGEKRVGGRVDGLEQGSPGLCSLRDFSWRRTISAHFTQIRTCSFFSSRALRSRAWDAVP